MAAGRPELEREAEAGSYALETLLEQQVDKAFDKFTAYALRNIFAVPDGLELVMVSLHSRPISSQRTARDAWGQWRSGAEDDPELELTFSHGTRASTSRARSTSSTRAENPS